MSWRVVMIQNPARLNLCKGQLHIAIEAEIHSLPLEDVAVLMLESPEISLTSALLSACMAQGIAIVSCDASHLPNGVMQRFAGHSRWLQVLKLQFGCSEPLRKRLWQKIVQSKIHNQTLCLAELGINHTSITPLIKKVQSGDPDNIEAQAARLYWPLLFGRAFTRSASNNINAALNYGYAIIRAMMARALVAYGLLPALGLHHVNELNPFNLTDDLMEVLRPIVDAQVFLLHQQGLLTAGEGLNKQTRQELARIGSSLCAYAGEQHNLLNICDKMTANLIKAMENNSAALLLLPSLLTKADGKIELSA